MKMLALAYISDKILFKEQIVFHKLKKSKQIDKRKLCIIFTFKYILKWNIYYRTYFSLF